MARYYRKKPPTFFDSTLFVFIALLLGIGFLFSRVVPFGLDRIQLYLFFLGGMVLLSGAVLIYIIIQQEKKRLRAIALSDVDHMSGVEFEHYVVALLKSQGYEIEHTGKTGDFGTDAVGRKGKDRYSIQIKRYSNTVNADAIRQAFTAMKAYNCNLSMVVTNNFFTREAKKLAEWNNCILVDRNTLIDWIMTFQKKK